MLPGLCVMAEDQGQPPRVRCAALFLRTCQHCTIHAILPYSSEALKHKPAEEGSGNMRGRMFVSCSTVRSTWRMLAGNSTTIKLLH